MVWGCVLSVLYLEGRVVGRVPVLHPDVRLQLLLVHAVRDANLHQPKTQQPSGIKTHPFFKAYPSVTCHSYSGDHALSPVQDVPYCGTQFFPLASPSVEGMASYDLVLGYTHLLKVWSPITWYLGTGLIMHPGYTHLLKVWNPMTWYWGTPTC